MSYPPTVTVPWHHQANTESLGLCEKLPVAFFSSVWPTVEPEPAEKRSIYPQRWMLAPSKWTIRKEHNLRRDKRVMEHSLNPLGFIDWRCALRPCLRGQLQSGQEQVDLCAAGMGERNPCCSVRQLLIAIDNMESDAEGSAVMFLCVRWRVFECELSGEICMSLIYNILQCQQNNMAVCSGLCMCATGLLLLQLLQHLTYCHAWTWRS